MSCALPSMMSNTHRTDVTTSTIPASNLLVRFLSEEEGSKVLSSLEDTLNISTRVTAGGIMVQHDESIPIQTIERALMEAWHDRSMYKSMRVSLLTRSCADHRVAMLSVSQAAIVKMFAHLIQRDSGIADIIVETSGNVSWYGPKETVQMAQEIIRKLLHLYLPTHEAASELDNSRIRASTVLNGFSNDVPQVSPSGYDWNQNAFSRSSSAKSQQSLGSDDLNDVTGESRLSSRRRQQMLFMVKSTDAPRLIGTRGINKRKIEEATNCSITLHTESKKDGEFPVEVCGTSRQQCEMARNFIDSFLAPGGSLLDSEAKAKQQRDRERPKIHLQMSPKKAAGASSSTTSAIDVW